MAKWKDTTTKGSSQASEGFSGGIFDLEIWKNRGDKVWSVAVQINAKRIYPKSGDNELEGKSIAKNEMVNILVKALNQLLMA